jgi:thiosulfate dehydrogenase (quinone) large subunit
MMGRDARILLAGMQGVVGIEWLVSGFNKVLSGKFPQGLGAELTDRMQSNPNGWYDQLLRGLVVPHSLAFGYLIEYVELATGIALLCGIALLLSRPRPAGATQSRLEVAELAAVAAAALIGAFLTVNFHFLMGDGVIPALAPTRPFDEGIDLDTLLPPFCLIIALANVRLIDTAWDWCVRRVTEARVRPSSERDALPRQNSTGEPV